jgi:hypothetical protein
MTRHSTPTVLAPAVVLFALSACGPKVRYPPPPPPPAAEPPPVPVPRAEPLPPLPPPETQAPRADAPGPVELVKEPIVVAAWAEPRRLPTGGGQTQILVRVQHRNGQRFGGVEVRLATSEGSLYSAGRVLTTDASGMTRDRLTTQRSAVVTLNAGGTLYRLDVPVGAE